MKKSADIKNQNPLDINENKEPSSFRLIFTLGLAGFLSGLLLVAIYLYTKPLIEENKAKAIELAILKVLPDCTSFKTLSVNNGKITEYNLPSINENKGNEPKLIYLGYNSSNEMKGFAILGSIVGFQDIITVMIGYNPINKTIIGYEVLESKETPGLGDKIFKDQIFLKNFEQLFTEPEILFAKKGEKTKSNEMEAITGATISSKAVLRLLNNSLNEWKIPIKNFMEDNNKMTSEIIK